MMPMPPRNMPPGAMPSSGFNPNPPGSSPMPDDAGEAEPMQMPVPLAMLAQPSDKEEMIMPEVGDIITMQVDAKVCSIKGDMAMICPQAINGKPLDNDGDETGEEPQSPEDAGDDDAAEGSALQSQAQGIDAENQ